jgi:integrase
MSVGQLIVEWVGTIKNENTKRCYKNNLNKIVANKIIDAGWTVEEFGKANHKANLQRINGLQGLGESTLQRVSSAYLSFVGWMHERYSEIVPEVKARKGTFRILRSTAKTKAMSLEEAQRFLEALEKNPEVQLIAMMGLDFAKRINETLSLRIEDINLETKELRFRQLKTKGADSTWVTMRGRKKWEMLLEVKGDRRRGLLFDRCASGVNQHFKRAGLRAEIDFPVTTHVLRATAITLLAERGVPALDIMKISGHKSISMISYYDKSDKANNWTRRGEIVPYE